MTDVSVSPSRARGDLVAAYAATGAKLLGWLVAAAVVYRYDGAAAFAVLMIARATVGLLNYTTFGLGPALVQQVAAAERSTVEAEVLIEDDRGDGTLAYERVTDDEATRFTALPPTDPRSPASLLASALIILPLLAFIGGAVVLIYSNSFERIHEVPRLGVGVAGGVASGVGFGTLFRLVADAVGGATQGLGRLRLDQWFAAAADLSWIAVLLLHVQVGADISVGGVAFFFAATGLVGLIVRLAAAAAATGLLGERGWAKPTSDAAGKLLGVGLLLTLGSAADFLYAPIDYFILNRLVDPLSPAVYAPAIQVDAAILILTTAIATVALPSAARLYAGGQLTDVWRQYVRGSLLAGGVALAAGLVAWAMSPWVFELWLGNDLPATRAILPLVLLHTILGSAAGVGRATLIAAGRAGSYAAVVLVGGAVNVIVSVLLVWAGWGIYGVVTGTVLSVALRCLIALPWLVRRATREQRAQVSHPLA